MPISCAYCNTWVSEQVWGCYFTEHLHKVEKLRGKLKCISTTAFSAYSLINKKIGLKPNHCALWKVFSTVLAHIYLGVFPPYLRKRGSFDGSYMLIMAEVLCTWNWWKFPLSLCCRGLEKPLVLGLHLCIDEYCGDWLRWKRLWVCKFYRHFYLYFP